MMESGSLLFSFFLIFTGASVLATGALFTRQPLLVAYIALGALLGPFGLEVVNDTNLLNDIAHVGIIFLLFLLGLDMQPSHLAHLLKKNSNRRPFELVSICSYWLQFRLSVWFTSE